MFEVPATARSSADTPCCWAVVGVFWCKGQSDFIWDRSGLYYLDCQCRKLAGALKKTKQGLSFERRLLRPAGTGAYFCSSLGRLRGGRQMDELALSALRGAERQGLSFEIWFGCPAGTEAFLLSSLGRLRGGRQMGAC